MEQYPHSRGCQCAACGYVARIRLTTFAMWFFGTLFVLLIVSIIGAFLTLPW